MLIKNVAYFSAILILCLLKLYAFQCNVSLKVQQKYMPLLTVLIFNNLILKCLLMFPQQKHFRNCSRLFMFAIIDFNSLSIFYFQRKLLPRKKLNSQPLVKLRHVLNDRWYWKMEKLFKTPGQLSKQTPPKTRTSRRAKQQR